MSFQQDNIKIFEKEKFNGYEFFSITANFHEVNSMVIWINISYTENFSPGYYYHNKDSIEFLISLKLGHS